MTSQLKTFTKSGAEVKPIQGLYDEDAQDGEFYTLLAKVLLAGFSEKRQRKKEQK